MNIVKTEGIVSKTYTSEPDTLEIKFVVRGETHEEKLQELVNTVPAHRLLLAMAIGDIHLNSLTYSQASQKYEFSKSQIQRAISGKANHKKGGKQYHLEQKRKASSDTTSPMEAKKDKSDKVPEPAIFPSTSEIQGQETLPDLTQEEGDEEFPEVDIDT